MLYQSNRSKCTLTFSVGLAARSIPVFVPIQKGDLERVNHPSNTDKDEKQSWHDLKKNWRVVDQCEK